MDRNVGDYQIGAEQLLEHVGTNVSLLNKLSGRASGHTRQCHRGPNKLGLDTVEIDSIFSAEGPHYKCVEHRLNR
jgi:hypothetical protein